MLFKPYCIMAVSVYSTGREGDYVMACILSSELSCTRT